MTAEFYQVAKNKFLSGDFSSVENYFEQNNFLLESAYCKLLSGDSEGAKKIFEKIAEEDLRADWGKKLIQFIDGNIIKVPTYFQIRNFLEIDLNLLIQAEKIDYIQNILNGADIFYSANPESYKFIARVMYYNDFIDLAMHYLNKAKDNFFYDPELHLILANCYLQKDQKNLAKQSINNCLSILPNYIPAKKLLSKIM